MYIHVHITTSGNRKNTSRYFRISLGHLSYVIHVVTPCSLAVISFGPENVDFPTKTLVPTYYTTR